ncbi:MAG: DUF2344 domain-containing protein [Clostridia bacterium]|nr:DUF2344 domain-containing protein [Clostridia bacterium]
MFKVRFCFEKTETAAYISHLDLMKCLQRSFTRAGIPVRYSQGFNPHIEMSIVVPLSTGYESRCDLCDLDLVTDELPADFVDRLNAALPRGMRVLSAKQADRPVNQIAYCAYEIRFPAGDVAAMTALLTSPVKMEKKSKRGSREVDLLDYIKEITFESAGEKTVCRCILAAGNDPLNPMYLTKALKNAGFVPEDAAVHYVRTGILDENCQNFYN